MPIGLTVDEGKLRGHKMTEAPALPEGRSLIGEGLSFRKYFKKFAGLARREKFPEICSDRHYMGTSDPLKMVSDPLETT